MSSTLNPAQRPLLMTEEGPDITVEITDSEILRLGLRATAVVTGIGPSAYSQTVDSFAMPANGASVTVRANASAWTAPGAQVFVAGAGFFAVTQVIDAQHLKLTALNVTQLASATSVIPQGALVTPIGSPGLQGPVGPQGPAGTNTVTAGPKGDPGVAGNPGANAFTTTSAAFSMPASGASQSVSVGSTQWMARGEFVFVAGAGYFSVASVLDGQTAVLTALPVTQLANPNALVSAGALVTPGGAIGAQGPQGVGVAGAAGAPGVAGTPAYAALLDAFLMPATGASITAHVSGTSWVAVGEVVFVAGAGWFSVTGVVDATHVALTSLGVTQLASVGAAIPVNSLVAPSGPVGPSGLTGATGTGTTGAAGMPAYTSTSGAFTMPANGANVSIVVGSTGWMAPGDIVFVQGAGWFSTASIQDATHATLTALSVTQIAAPAAQIGSGALVTPSGVTGPAGSAGVQGNAGVQGQGAFTTTTGTFVMPANGSNTSSISVGSTAWTAVNADVFVANAGWFAVVSIQDPTHLTLMAISTTQIAAVGSTVSVGALMTPSGPQGIPGTGGTGTGPKGDPGVAGAAGASAFTTTTASFLMPANGATVTNVLVGSTAWTVAGDPVFIQGAGYFTVSSVPDAQHLSLTASPVTQIASTGATLASPLLVAPSGAVGPQGPTGATGAVGSQGQSAFTTLSQALLMPGPGSTVTANVGSTAWMSLGLPVFLAGAGFFTVTAIASATQATLTQSQTGAIAAIGNSIAIGALVTPSGATGIQGTTGASGNTGPQGQASFSNVTQSFSMPANGSNVTLTVGSTAWAAPGLPVFVQGAGYFLVVSLGSSTSLTVQALPVVQIAAVNATVSGNPLLTPCGLPGVTGAQGVAGVAGVAGSQGVSAFTTSLDAFTMPTNGANVALRVGSVAWTAAGEPVFIQGAGYFSVASIPDATHLSLTALSTTQLAVAGATVSANVLVTPSGAPGLAGTQGLQGLQGVPGQNTNLMVTDAFQVPAGSDYAVTGTLMQSASGPLTSVNQSTVTVSALAQGNNPGSVIWTKVSPNADIQIPPNQQGIVNMIFRSVDTAGRANSTLSIAVQATDPATGIAWPVGSYLIQVT